MKESYGEGPASHTGPESCVDGREAIGEALTGGTVGRVLSREMNVYWGADALGNVGRQHLPGRIGEDREGPTRSETPRMQGNTSHGSRKIPRLASEFGAEVRAVNPTGARRR